VSFESQHSEGGSAVIPKVNLRRLFIVREITRVRVVMDEMPAITLFVESLLLFV
jgi:hypothetical protein